jgi:hypothetical protein
MIGVKKPSLLPTVRVFLFPCLPSLAASVLDCGGHSADYTFKAST